MVETNRQVQSRDPFDRFDEAISDPRLYEADQSRYEQLRRSSDIRRSTANRSCNMSRLNTSRYRYEQPFALSFERTETLPDELPPHEAVPLFLANYEEEHQQLSE